jgi:hydroxymethylbilane synthase
VVPLRIATRGSELALWQARHVADLLTAADPSIEIELVVVRTTGDQRVDVPIWELGGKGVFVAEVRTAVLDGRAELAVHSAKDLPAVPVEGLELVAVPERADARDALVGGALEDLAPGALVATGSVRRRAQLAWARPDLRFCGVRGNIATRLDHVGRDGIDAVVVAVAALDRLVSPIASPRCSTRSSCCLRSGRVRWPSSVVPTPATTCGPRWRPSITVRHGGRWTQNGGSSPNSGATATCRQVRTA